MSNTTTPAPALSATDANEQITKLEESLAAAEGIARVLLADPHFSKCPFVAAIRGPISRRHGADGASGKLV